MLWNSGRNYSISTFPSSRPSWSGCTHYSRKLLNLAPYSIVRAFIISSLFTGWVMNAKKEERMHPAAVLSTDVYFVYFILRIVKSLINFTVVSKTYPPRRNFGDVRFPRATRRKLSLVMYKSFKWCTRRGIKLQGTTTSDKTNEIRTTKDRNNNRNSNELIT